MDKKIKSLVVLAAVVVLLLWLATGIYTLNDTGGEEAVILRFGKYVNSVTTAGLHWHLPSPIEKIEIVRVEETKRLEFGFRTTKSGSTTQTASYTSNPEEALMLTQDENIVSVETSVQ